MKSFTCFFLLCLLLSAAAFSQSDEDTFALKSATSELTAETTPARSTESHRFWDRQNKISFAISAGIRAGDVAQTCYGLAHGARELTLPTQSCAGVAAFVFAGQGEQVVGQWIAHRKGWHRVERMLPYISAAPNAFAIGYSLTR